MVSLFVLVLAIVPTMVPMLGAAPSPLGRNTLDQIQQLHDEKISRTPAQLRLDSQLLLQLRSARGELAARGLGHLRGAELRRHADGRLLVDFVADVTPAVVQSITQAGGTVLSQFPRHQAIRAWVPLSELERLASIPGVHRIRPAAEATTNVGAVTTEGDITHLAAAARATYGIAGAGVKIGVLSDSVDFLADAQAAGELGPVTILPGQSGAGRTGEGTAMLEIIHDIAPDAQLFFGTAFLGEAGFAQNIRDLYAAGCRILVDDVNYFDESPFQDGVIAQAVAEVCAGGALYFSAAGNSGNLQNGTSGVWEGDFLDGGAATLGRGGRLHDFGGTTVNPFAPGGGFRRVDLFWSDPLGHSTNDYDVYVLDAQGNVAALSTNVQNGNDDPIESIPSLGVGDRIVVVKYAGAGRFLHLSTGRGVLTVRTGGAVTGHNASAAPNAFSVGATWVKSPPQPFVGGPANPVETFSSDGPRRIFYHADGSPITPGDLSSKGGLLLPKPDLIAADGVSTSLAPFSPFFGTSAAAPHAAAIAALLWSYNPALTPDALRLALASSALDAESPGFDPLAGSGIVMVPAAVEASPAPSPRLVYTAATVLGGNGNGSLDPNECAQLQLLLHNEIGQDGAPATGVSATLRSLSPFAAADPLPVAFADIPAAGFSSNAIPFIVSTLPGMLCGTMLPFELTITSSNGGVAVQQFELPTTPPGVGVPVVFTPTGLPTAIPDLATIESSVQVAGVTLPTARVTLSAYITHTYVSDLVLSLIAPDGTLVELASRSGNGGQNYGLSCAAPTIFDDSAPTALIFGTAPFAGSFQPLTPLAVFNGLPATSINGTWRLRVSDVAEGDSGTLQCWSLNIAPIQCLDGGGVCFSPPEISLAPAPLTLTNGQAALFTVSATGTGPLAYQWYFQGTNAIPGATGAQLQIPSVADSNTGLYSVVVSNRYGLATSPQAALLVITPARFVSQPASLLVTNGSPATLASAVEGTAPLTAQWYRSGGVAVPGAVSPTLTIGAASPADSGGYYLVVSNTYGTATSSVATLTVVTPPSITAQPTGLTITRGQTAALTVGVAGTGPLSFQWFHNETLPVAGATAQTLTFPSVAVADAGSYHVQVSSPYGSVRSAEAVLTVVIPDLPPVVTLDTPTSGATYAAAGLPIPLTATATDPDGTVSRVDFYADGLRLHSASTPPYRFDWIDPLPGTHSLTAVAVDDLGGASTSTVARVTVQLGTPAVSSLIATGSVWKYLDTGTDQGTAWVAPGFDDSTWASGPAELGYGDSVDGRPEATVLSYGPAANNKYITYYFRRPFVLTDPGSITNLLLRIVRDDGAVVYLNGTEVYRSNLPTGAITYKTLATVNVNGNAEATYNTGNVPVNLLAAGTNWVAVEIHQVNATSADISFDFELRATRETRPRFLLQPTPLAAIAHRPASLVALAEGAQPLSYQWLFNRTNRLAGETNTLLQFPNPVFSQAGSYAVVASNSFGVLTSTVVSVTVDPDPLNLPPVVSLGAPLDGGVFTFDQLPLALSAAASDPEGSVTNVAFYTDGTLLSSTAANPFQAQWIDPMAGVHSLYAVATDDEGLSSTSSPISITVTANASGIIPILPMGTVWRYNDKGLDLGTSWRASAYDDSAWTAGPAELGYGDAVDGRPEATVISYGPNSSSKYPTAYFRRSFLLTDPASFTGLHINLLRDDGAVVYLNGSELFRDNMPAGTVSYSTLASTAINGTAETNLVQKDFGGAGLVAGLNTVAVEIHQNAVNSPDLSFALELTGIRKLLPEITQQPVSQSVPSGTNVTLSVRAAGPGLLTYQWYFNVASAVAGGSAQDLLLTGVSTNQSGAYACVVANAYGSVTSSPAALVVQPPPANLPPVVALTSPADGALFGQGATIPILATASDSGGGSVARVDLLADGVPLASVTVPPYSVNWTNASLGIHLLTARATDSTGLSSTSAPVTVTVAVPTTVTTTLIPAGAVWRYLDTGVDQGTAWRAASFNDASWKSGPALLGYGNAAKGRPEATLLGWGTDPNNRYPTYYFRKAFVVSNHTAVTQLELRLLRDDGAIVYLNGTRVLRSNMPASGSSYSTYAATAVTGVDETTYFTNLLSTASLVEGTNVLAIDVHQASATSDDLAFDAILIGQKSPPPVITSQPQSLTVTNGANATFSVTATGSGTLSYQWYLNGTNAVNNGTQSSLLLEAVTTNQAGAYSVVVRNSAGATSSDPAQLTVVIPAPNRPPVVSWVAPANGSTNVLGSIIPLQLAASDPDGSVATIDLYDGGTRLTQLLAPTLAFDWINAGLGVHTLRAVATDNRGGTASATNTVTVIPPPPPPTLAVSLIATGSVWRYLDTGTDQGKAWRLPSFSDASWPQGPAELGYGDGVEGRPEATVLNYGPNANSKYITYYFRQTFVMDAPSSYTNLSGSLLRDDGAVVYLNGTEVFRSNMPGGTITYATLASSDVTKTLETTFYPFSVSPSLLVAGTNLLAVEVHQFAANSPDLSFDLSLEGTRFGAPVIVSQPQNQDLAAGATAQFSVVAVGATPLRYQWFLNGLTPLGGATNATLSIPNVQAANGGSYSVQVSNAVGSVRSAEAVLTLKAPPLITTQPASQTVSVGTDVNFSVVASGAAPLSYQWFFNTTAALSGQTGPTLHLPAVQNSNAGGYSVRVTNPGGSVTSAVATLSVVAASVPQILVQPLPVSTNAGVPVQLSVTAVGAPVLTYQWLLNATTRIAGATNSTLLFPSATGADNGLYSVQITNKLGTVTSLQVEVRILENRGITRVQYLGPDVALTFPSANRLLYSVEYKDTVSAPLWTPVPGATLLKGTGGDVTIIDPNANPGFRFYRLRVE